MRTLNFSDTQPEQQSAQQQPVNNPIGKFSQSIIEMLNQAKAGELDTTQQKTNLQKEMYGSIIDSDYLSDPTLSPQAQEKLALSEAQEYEPGISILDSKLNQLRDTMDMLKKTYDKDWTKIMPVSEQTGKIIKAAFRQGKNLTTEELGLYKDFITEDDVMAWANSKKSEDKPTATETKDAKNRQLFNIISSQIKEGKHLNKDGKLSDKNYGIFRMRWQAMGGDGNAFDEAFEQYKPQSASAFSTVFDMSTYNK